MEDKKKKRTQAKSSESLLSLGGADGIRTHGLFRAREARSQLRYSPNR